MLEDLHRWLNDVVHTSYGHSQREATKYATADEAECHDVGKDAAGLVFPDDPQQRTAWTFEGHPPEQVLGGRFDETSVAVFVADSTPRTTDNAFSGRFRIRTGVLPGA